MKKIAGLLLLSLLLLSCTPKEEGRYAGTKTPYTYQEVAYTNPPEGYYPFYLDYTGRHGSRYMGDPTDKQVAEVLLMAKEAGQLTAKGDHLLDQAEQLVRLNEGNYGLLSDLGEQELEGIGRRALSLYSEVFGNSSLKVLTTDVKRTKQSAEAFLSSYVSLYDTIAIQQELDTAQTTLRFFSYSDAYNSYRKSDYVTAVVDSIRASVENEQHTKNVIEGIFEAGFIAKLDAGVVLSDGSTYNSKKLAVMMYDLYAAVFSFSEDIVKSFHLDFDHHFFSNAEKKWFDRAASCRSYMTLGPAFDINGIQAKVAAPLLISILKTADSVVNGKQLDAYLKFGHAETTTPLATLMEIEGANNSAASILSFDSCWSTENIAPMAANIQLVFYKHQDADKPVLVKVLLNEKEVRIPVETDTYPYYKWENVREYYYNKMAKLAIDIDMQPMELLQALS